MKESGQGSPFLEDLFNQIATKCNGFYASLAEEEGDDLLSQLCQTLAQYQQSVSIVSAVLHELVNPFHRV